MDLAKKKHAILEMLTKIAREHRDKDLFHLPASEVKRLCGYFYIRQDIGMALATTKRLKEMISRPDTDEDADKGGVLDIMWYGILITYSRCFTNNKGGQTTIDQSIFSGRQDFFSIHNRIWTTRNTFIAHREDTDMLASTMTIAVPKNGPKLYILEAQRKRFLLEDLDDYTILFSFLKTAVDAKIEREKSRISKFLNSATIEQVEAMKLTKSISQLLEDLNRAKRAESQ